jgi:hypothetical protein
VFNLVPSSLTIVVFLIAIFLTLLLIFFYLLKIAQQGRYNEKEHRAQLDSLRASYEDQTYKITNRLMAAEDRWRDVNHLLISSQIASSKALGHPQKIVLTNFLKSSGVSREDLVVDKKLVFVLTPLHPDYLETYKAIQSVCNETGLKSLRGDEENVNDILPYVLRSLVKARIVVANIDGRNPNVFYELGIAHALDKGTILVSKSSSELPLDFRTKQIIIYQEFEELKSRLRDEFIKVLSLNLD